MKKLPKTTILKEYFGTPDKPVTLEELKDLMKADRPGYDELAQLAAEELGVEILQKTS